MTEPRGESASTSTAVTAGVAGDVAAGNTDGQTGSAGTVSAVTITAAIPGVPVLETLAPTALASPMLPTPSPNPYPWDDANAVMSGLCFESVNDAAERTFILHSDAELGQFFDLADNSRLCRHPVTRGDFAFSGDRLLVGRWDRAVGCAAQHQVIDVRRDDVARTYVIDLRLVVTGGCDYELVRPFWIGLSGVSGYDVRLLVED